MITVYEFILLTADQGDFLFFITALAYKVQLFYFILLRVPLH